MLFVIVCVCLLQADDIRALLIDAMPPDALPSCLKPQATVVSVHAQGTGAICGKTVDTDKADKVFPPASSERRFGNRTDVRVKKVLALTGVLVSVQVQ